MAWADDHLARHRISSSVVLTAIHDDGSHTAEGQTNRLAHLSGIRELRVGLAEYLGIRLGAEHAALAAASAVWRTMPPMPAHAMTMSATTNVGASTLAHCRWPVAVARCRVPVGIQIGYKASCPRIAVPVLMPWKRKTASGLLLSLLVRYRGAVAVVPTSVQRYSHGPWLR